MSVTVVVKPRRWTGEEYDRLVETGLFRPEERVELVDGEILTMAALGTEHVTATRLAEDALRAAFGPGYEVRVQMPLALDPASRPEPDVAVAPGSPRDYKAAHPQTALLIVEVSDTTLDYDRAWKGSLYARARIADYWLLNLVDRVVEVHREPAPMARAKHGWEYRRVQRLGEQETVSPLARPGVAIKVADLLP